MILYRGTQTRNFRRTYPEEGVLTWSTNAAEAKLYAQPDGFVTKAAVKENDVLTRKESWLFENAQEITTPITVTAKVMWTKQVSEVTTRGRTRDLEVY